MKVRRTSWHYRLYRYLHNIERGPRYLNPLDKAARNDPPLPSSLCPYAWSIFLALIGVAFIVAVLAAVSPLLLIVGALVWLSRHVRVPRITLNRTPKPEKPPRERKPSLAAAYIRARKQKVCPTISLVD